MLDARRLPYAVLLAACSAPIAQPASADSTERVNVSSAGVEADMISGEPVISADGRFVSYYSLATTLVTDDTNGEFDVFVRDRLTGTTERVSVASGGVEATGGGSFLPSISADGRFVAFHSSATDLVTGDTNVGDDVFVHDRQTGTTERGSVTSAGAEAIGGDSFVPAISADGRFVAFNSGATNLVAGDTDASDDIFVHDRLTGKTERVSVDSAGAEANSGSEFPWISANGRFVTFRSSADNLVPGDTNSLHDVFVRDTGLAPDGNNDVLADFGGAGLWQRLNDAAWQKIHAASPALLGSRRPRRQPAGRGARQFRRRGPVGAL